MNPDYISLILANQRMKDFLAEAEHMAKVKEARSQENKAKKPNLQVPRFKGFVTFVRRIFASLGIQSN